MKMQKYIYWQDGSVDLFAGLGLTWIAVAWLCDLIALGPLAAAVFVPSWVAFRRRVVEPRLGHVRFNEQRQSRLRKAHVTLIGIGSHVLPLSRERITTRVAPWISPSA